MTVDDILRDLGEGGKRGVYVGHCSRCCGSECWCVWKKHDEEERRDIRRAAEIGKRNHSSYW